MFAIPPQLQLSDRSDPKDLLMFRSLSDVNVPTRADEIFYWRSDQF